MSASFDRNTAATGNSDAGFWDDAEMVERPDGSPILQPLDRAPTYHTIADATSLSTNGRTEEEDSTVPPPPYEGPSEVADEEVGDKKEQAEEIAPDVLVDVLFEEVINDYSLGGPFVRRLKAYQTPSGDVVIREEKIQIEVGTKLEMAPFADCTFRSDYSGGFNIRNQNWTASIEITRRKIAMTSDDCTFNNHGPGQSMNIGNKAICTKCDSNGVTYVFNVKGRAIEVSSNGSTVSNSTLPVSPGGVIHNFIGVDMDQVNHDARSAMEAGFRAGVEGRRAGDQAAEEGRRAAEEGRRAGAAARRAGQLAAEEGRRAAEEGRRAGAAARRAGQLAAEEGRRAAEEGRRAAAAARNATQNMFVPTVSTVYSGRGMQINHSGSGSTIIGTTRTYVDGELVELNGMWF